MATTILTGLQILSVERGALNNSITCQMGEVGTSVVESENAQLMQQSGFVSIPPQPVPGQTASESIVIRGAGNRDYVIATRDVLSQQIYANMNYGESMMYAAGSDGQGQARFKCDTNGNVLMYTTDDNTAKGNGMSFSMLTGANGQTASLSFFAPFGSFVFDSTGFHMQTVSGGTFDLGGINLPAPLSSALPNTYCNINAGMITLNGMCNLGVAGPSGSYLPAVMALTPIPTPTPLPLFTTTANSTIFFALGI